MTIKELIAELEKQNQELEIEINIGDGYSIEDVSFRVYDSNDPQGYYYIALGTK